MLDRSFQPGPETTLSDSLLSCIRFEWNGTEWNGTERNGMEGPRPGAGRLVRARNPRVCAGFWSCPKRSVACICRVVRPDCLLLIRTPDRPTNSAWLVCPPRKSSRLAPASSFSFNHPVVCLPCPGIFGLRWVLILRLRRVGHLAGCGCGLTAPLGLRYAAFSSAMCSSSRFCSASSDLTGILGNRIGDITANH